MKCRLLINYVIWQNKYSMNPSLNEKFLAYLALFSGITLSIVAEYYSILGLMAIFSAAPWSVVVMGVALGVGKITATLWLKQNWSIAPWTIRGYLLTAITILILITSLGIFGFLSKAHSDASLVTGDVQSRIAVYDQQINTAKENIDANRKALKQMDEAVDQVMARSTLETGANRAVRIRSSQQRERARLQSEIQAEQKAIVSLGQERAPIAAEVRKVEAKVGPIKYLAQFVYGEANETLLEKAVTWVIVILIVVFDPLALILLLASQISFQNFREQKIVQEPFNFGPTEYIPDSEEEAFYAQHSTAEGNSPSGPVVDVVSPEPTVANLDDDAPAEFEWTEQGAEIPKVEKSLLEQHPYLLTPATHFKNSQPMVYKAEGDSPRGTNEVVDQQPPTVTTTPEIERPGDYLAEPLFVQNEEQRDSNLWTSTSISKEEYLKASEESDLDPYNDRPNSDVAEYIVLVKSGKMSLHDVPAEYLLAVKARI